MSQPPATLISVTHERAVFEARPREKGWAIASAIGAGLTAAAAGYAYIHKVPSVWSIVLVLTFVEAFISVLALLAPKAFFRVELMLQTRRILITDTRVLSAKNSWEGAFDDLGTVEAGPEGLVLRWKSGEPGPTLLAPDSVRKSLGDVLKPQPLT
jgi:hypothetical protein